MEKKMELSILCYIGTIIRIHSFLDNQMPVNFKLMILGVCFVGSGLGFRASSRDPSQKGEGLMG